MIQTTKRERACPVCGTPGRAPHQPFCSDRCAKVDLGRWLNEDYRIPAVEEDDMDDAPDEQ
jgi:endogenous inhibitor of DNA gyrase (YacG/DUF329 family)